MTTRTKQPEEEEDQVDLWDITMEQAEIDIPNRTGKLEQSEAKMEANGTTDGEVVIESLNGPIFTAVEGVFEGMIGGVFEGVVEGDMELVGNGTTFGTGELKGTVSEPERAISLDAAEAEMREHKGTAAWKMKPRYTTVADMTGGGDGQTVEAILRTQRANTGTMVWFFLYKAPDYVNADLVGGVWEGYIDVGRVDGDRWLIGSTRCVAGQRAHIQSRNIHLRRREKLWLLAIVGRRMRSEENSASNDFVHCAIGVAQRCENY
jgi:hypothetical protein